MFGIGNKNNRGEQVRIEHRGRSTRLSRTGGPAFRASKKVGKITLTANTSKGIRASMPVARGLRVAVQDGRPSVIGRWSFKAMSVNLSRSGASLSVGHPHGRLNLTRPGSSSFRMLGIQMRGAKVIPLTMITLIITLAIKLVFAIIFFIPKSLFPRNKSQKNTRNSADSGKF